MLEVEAIIVSTGKKAKIQINVMEIEEAIDLSQWESTSRAKEFKSMFRKIDRMVKNNTHDELEHLVDLAESLKVALIKNNDSEIDDIEDTIIELLTE